MSEAEAAEYEAPFEYARQVIKPIRESNNRERTRTLWWIHGESRPGMRVALSDQSRYLVSPIVAKHRIFAWLSPEVLPGNKCVAFAREDDYFLGVLQSRAHETWAVNMATRHGVGNDPAYHVRNCFETFPLPWSPGEEPNDDPRFVAIAAAAKALDSKRQAWLNPPDATPDVLKKRTLTNLYNERPTWLAMLHADLDRAVWNAYGWDDADPSATSEDSILSRLLALNGERSSMH